MNSMIPPATAPIPVAQQAVATVVSANPVPTPIADDNAVFPLLL